MQRQSLGGGGASPGSKQLHNLYGAGKVEKLINEEVTEKRRLAVAVVSSASDIEEEKKIKVDRHHRTAVTPFRAEKSIHLIPILTICCLLILYLCSYDPPQKDLDQFNGFRSISSQLDSPEMSSYGRVFELEKGDVLPIRSHRSLHEIRKDGRRSRVHRKIGGF